MCLSFDTAPSIYDKCLSLPTMIRPFSFGLSGCPETNVKSLTFSGLAKKLVGLYIARF
jgi:hypothetical protein